ncbi:MAG: prepilin-type N-terminal cleavage/methylation domain-containing protein [Candidatus Omnitrophica bacterium]|jgi:prepilin-type N-terminal cleavage/methylation domain-containing protein|nr:prepilin-type N-terminal cleavage/methylation domain-containing protein [Candidatus Omnitrophota bacterium]
MNRRKKAFTLIELIIVVVIIGILALVAIPKYQANIRKANRASIFNLLGVLRMAVLNYYAVNGVLPNMAAGANIATNIDGDMVYSAKVPSGYSTWWSPSRLDWYLYSPMDQFGCSYGIYINTGCVTITSGSAAECTVS